MAGAGPAAAATAGGPVSVRVAGRDRFAVNGRPVAGRAGLRAAVQKAGASAVQVDAGKGVPFAALVPVLDALKAAGAEQINVSLRVK